MILTTITQSYSRKLNHHLYVGSQYESSDHFISLSADLDEDENFTECSKELKDICIEMVDQSIESQIQSFQGGIPAPEFEKFMYDYVAGRVNSPETFDETRKRLSPSQFKSIDIIRRAKATRARDNK